ncbi:MAG TPA: hypothetical protein P5096_00090 [Patescibacteria group bacterium]|nr:hypothetical protein [Patescibacteria group bacterium]
MNQEEFNDLTNRYVKAENELADYRDKFVAISWEGEKQKMPEKVLTIESLNKLEEMREEVRKLEQEWFNAIGKLMN